MVNWSDIIAQQLSQAYMQKTLAYIASRREQGIEVFPPAPLIYNAFDLTPFDQVKVVILGQDPYHGPGQAHGLCFSVQPGIKVPPSLVNIYKELTTSIADFNPPNHGCLTSWAEQGVLLLNSVLTVESGQANAHQRLGWGQFTDVMIGQLNEHREGIVFLLWGSHAQKKGRIIDAKRHVVLNGPHPSPLSAYRGFFGCGHFAETNEQLQQQGKKPINWQLPEID